MDCFLFGLVSAFFFYMFLVFVHYNLFKRSLIGDTSWHYLLIKTLKEEKRYRGITSLLMRDQVDFYPHVFHWISSFFSLRFLKSFQWVPNLIISMVFHGILFLYLDFINIRYYGFRSYEFFWIYLFFLFFQRHQFCLSEDKILNIQLSERFLSSLSSSFYYMCLYFYLLTGDTLSFYLMLFSGVLSWFVSRFSRQALLFSSIVLTVFLFSIKPLVLLLVTFMISFLIGGKVFLKGIEHHISFLYQYCVFYKNGTVVKNHVLKKGYIGFKEIKSCQSFYQFISLLKNRPPFDLIFHNPEILLVASFFVFFPFGYLEFVFFLAPITVFLITSFSKLIFLGEPDRYIQYLLKLINPFFCCLMFRYNESSYFICCIYCLFFIVYLVKYLSFMLRDYLINPFRDTLKDLLDSFEVKKQDVFLCIPQTLGSAVVVRKDCKAFCQGGFVSLNYRRNIVLDPPFIRHDWDEILQKYSVNYILVDKKTNRLIDDRCSWSYNYNKLNLLLENSDYILYSIF